MTNRNLGERVSKLLGRPLFWVVAIGTLFALPIVRTLLRPPPKLPPIHGVIPEALAGDAAGLVRESGQPFALGELKGKVWLAARFQLDDQKPAAHAMLDLERHVRKLADAFAMVSVAAPGSEGADRLREYALNHRTNARRWVFLTGPDAAALLHALRLDGPAGSSENELVLVDSQLRIRAFYDVGSADPAQEKDTRDQLLYDAALLVNHY